jgi:small subunit ribosomal protein S20
MIAEARAIDIGNTEILRHRLSFAPMPAKKRKRSALKRIRQTQRRTSMRTIGRSAARTAVRTARDAISKGGEKAGEMISAAASALDKAAKRGSIHKNSARRRRSRIAKAATKAKKKS